MDSQPNHNTARFNPNPFGESESEGDAGNWAQNVATAEGAEEAESVSRSTSKDLDKEKTRQPSDEHLTLIETMRSAAHTAKEKLHLQNIRASGPSKLFHPTNVRVHLKWSNEGDQRTPGHITRESSYLWRARDNRKGKNSIAFSTTTASEVPPVPLKARAMFRFGKIGKNLLQMCITFPYWDMSFWSGWSYTWGSVLFIMDSVWSWESVARPASVSSGLVTYGASLTFFIGALLYELGATIAYLEAVNDGSFQGSAMRRFLEGHEADQKKMLDDKIHAFFGHLVPHIHHHHHNEDDEKNVDPEAGWKARERDERPGSIYPAGKAPAPRRGAVDHGETEEGTTVLYTSWRWFPTWKALRSHHAFEIGYLACGIQLFGATLYAICGLVGLPGILSSFQHHWQVEASYWVPEIVASVCFLTAAFLFTLETQEKWYRPEPTVVGWWIGLWAIIGSMGFLLCGIFGAASYNYTWCAYQSDLSSLWGSTAYLLSGLFQYYESMNKRPIEEMFNEPGELKSFQVHPI